MGTERDNYWTRPNRRFARRTFIAGAGSLAAGLAISACGGGDDDDSTGETPTGKGNQPDRKHSGCDHSCHPEEGWVCASQLHHFPHVRAYGGRRANRRLACTTTLMLRRTEAGRRSREKWEVTDPTTYVFQLRKGVKFQNLAQSSGAS